VPSSLRYLISDLRYWVGRHRILVAVAVVAIAAGTAGLVVALGGGGGDSDVAPAPAPDVVVGQVSVPEDGGELETDELGFPAFATKNTTRVAGPDPIANAAGVALATHPATGGVSGPDAVSLVDARDWRAGIAAASLAAAPIGAPILVTDRGEVPSLTADALAALDPPGSSETGGRQAFAIGAAARPDDLDVLAIDGPNAAALAAEVERARAELAGAPEHLVIASADEAGFAMPAASWAARSGDPVVFSQRNSLPAATREVLERRARTPVYVLGPESAISERAMDEIRELAPNAQRVAGEDEIANAIAFARYVDGSFGWNINDPGHGLVIATTARPLDAAAAAPLSAGGTWGPLLVVEDGGTVPAALRGYLLDLKPGYVEDPTRAVYNHAWLIGDADVLSVDFQAQVDELAEVAPVRSGSGG
jgi:hypothetical protein